MSASLSDPPRVIITVDLCVMGFEETEELLSAVSKALGLAERHQIVFTLSHTHAGLSLSLSLSLSLHPLSHER